MNRLIAAVAVIVISMMAACGTNNQPTVGKGRLAISLPAAGDDVKAFQIDVYKGDCSTLVASKCAKLEPGDLPTGLAAPAPQAGDHHFADSFFDVFVDVYCVKATPMDEGCRAPVKACSVPLVKVRVTAGKITEVVLVSNCDRPDTGALDVVAVVNNDPLIELLEYRPNKFVCVGTPLTVTVTATDPDGDPLTLTWQMYNDQTQTWDPLPCSVPGPGPLQCELVSLSLVGNYQARVTACDPGGLCAKLQFPIHVYDCPPPPPPPLRPDGGSPQ